VYLYNIGQDPEMLKFQQLLKGVTYRMDSWNC